MAPSIPRPSNVTSLPEVCDVEIVTAPGLAPNADTVPELLFEIPHGASATRHYDAIRAHLATALPDDLIDFFHVNTDVGSYEYARRVAEFLVDPGLVRELEPYLTANTREKVDALRPRSVALVRCLIPRTFVDTNRVLEDSPGGDGPRLTSAVNEYIRDPRDVDWLLQQHRRYHEVARAAYAWILDAGGLACTPHTYAPKSIEVHDFDEGIGKALRAAYEPEAYAKWTVRPHIDLITVAPDGTRLTPERWVEGILRNGAQAGWDVKQNETYPLHPVSMGYVYAAKYPGRVLCLEVRRDLLADPFTPFEEMSISDAKTSAVAAPLSSAYFEEVVTRR